jgi:hypothetical protein
VYDNAFRIRARQLRHSGVSVSSIARDLGVARSTVRDWLVDREVAAKPTGCFVCEHESCPCPSDYCYLLGQYLGDGYLAMSIRVPRLRISCCLAYPGIAAEVDAALAAVSGNRVGVVTAIGCTDRGTYWKHWPCVIPQHGVGPKHTRPITLTNWQRHLVREHPWPFVRGLIHSDGCRSLNRIVGPNGLRYAYPRYFFANESADILGIAGWALDLVGVQWRFNRRNSISVARRESVALMDEHIGPKS